MITNKIVLPIFIPLLTAALTLLWRKPSFIRRLVTICSIIIQLIIAIHLISLATESQWLILHVGSWKSWYGISLTADLFSCIMITLATLSVFISLIFRILSTKIVSGHPNRLGLIFFLLAGSNLAFSTGDFFNLFVAYEIMLIASYALFAIDANDEAIGRVFSYILINLIGSAIFLCTAAFIYKLFGTLSFAGIAQSSIAVNKSILIIPLGIMIFFVFALKSGFFPLYYWLPKSYPILPSSTIAIFTATLTEVGVYSIIRFFGTVYPGNTAYISNILIILAVPTMIFGVIGALRQKELMHNLCFQLICQIGFIMLTIGSFTTESLTTCIFYMVHHVIVFASLFLMGGIIRNLASENQVINTFNLWKKAPFLSSLFLIQSLSLIGIPPFSGFWPKLLMINNLIQNKQFIILFLMLIASLLTAINMLQILYKHFWPINNKIKLNTTSSTRLMQIPVTGLVIISLLIGLYPDFLAKLSEQSAKIIKNSKHYSELVTNQEPSDYSH